MKPAVALTSALLAAVAALAAQAPGAYLPREEKLPGPEVAQPIAFSHRVHAAKAGLECLACRQPSA